MELRRVDPTFDTAEETAQLLSPSHRDNVEIESYFVEYAVQKETINRNRCPASRRLLGQTARLADFNPANGNRQKVVYFFSFRRICRFLDERNVVSSDSKVPTPMALLRFRRLLVSA